MRRVEIVGPPSPSVEKYRAMLTAAPDAMILADEAGRIVMANEQAATMFGHAAGALIGMAVEELMPTRFRARHVGHRTAFLDEPRVRPMGAGLDLQGVRADGTEFPIEISLSPVQEPDGRTFVLAALRDVTARKQTEAVLRRARVARPLVRRIVRELVDRTQADRNTLQAVGERLATEAEATSVEEHLRVFEDMGLGSVSLRTSGDGRYHFIAHDLIETRPGARLTTCFLTSGFLVGAVSKGQQGERVLATEVACQSRGDATCEFVVQKKGRN